MKEKVIITIGRQFGSGGKDVGNLISQKLGIPVFDKKLITEAARQSGLSDELLAEADERTPNTLLHALSTGFGFGGFGAESIFKIQSDAIKHIADRESCIIIGRCADYVLRDYENCFNFFVMSPKEDRLARIIRRMNVDEKEAAELIEKTDKSRAAYYNFYTGKKWGFAPSYHFCLDSSLLGIEGTADRVVELARASLSAGRS